MLQPLLGESRLIFDLECDLAIHKYILQILIVIMKSIICYVTGHVH